MALDYSFFPLPMDESVDYMPLLFLSLSYLIREWSIQMEQQKNFSKFISGPSVKEGTSTDIWATNR